MLTFEQLQTFRAIVRSKTFTRAAEDLILTQPAISQRIRRMEQALGAEVFDRSTKGREFALTATGERVLRFADEALILLGQLQHDIEREKAARHHEVVNILCDPGPIKSLLPSLLAAFHERHPDIRVHLVHTTADRINAMLMDGEADIAVQVSHRVTPKLDALPILRDQMVLLAPPDHPAVTEPWRCETHVAGSGFVLTTGGYARQVAQEWAASQGFELDIVLESQNMDMVKEAVIRGLGLTVLPELWLTGDLQAGRLSIVPVSGMPHEFQVCLITRSGREVKASARALLEVAREGHWREQMPALQTAHEAVAVS